MNLMWTAGAPYLVLRKQRLTHLAVDREIRVVVDSAVLQPDHALARHNHRSVS